MNRKKADEADDFEVERGGGVSIGCWVTGTRIAPKDFPPLGFRSCDPPDHFHRSDHQDLIDIHLLSTDCLEHRNSPLTTSITSNHEKNNSNKDGKPLTLLFVNPLPRPKSLFRIPTRRQINIAERLLRSMSLSQTQHHLYHLLQTVPNGGLTLIADFHQLQGGFFPVRQEGQWPCLSRFLGRSATRMRAKPYTRRDQRSRKERGRGL